MNKHWKLECLIRDLNRFDSKGKKQDEEVMDDCENDGPS